MTTNPHSLADEGFAEQFFELLQADSQERVRCLNELARTDADLAAELSSLLAVHERYPDRLDSIDPDHAASLLTEDDDDLVPERAGPFKLVRELGRGGIGVVYLGERQGEGFDQQVAVKLIKRGMDSALILDRFRVERRILASLRHAHIAALIDGGMLDDGRPWFAMEYIEGEPLTDWCQRRRSSLEERLVLFEQVCRAVQHAHARLIIHRDIKPGNILVTDQGLVKLLDFGIAKLLAEEDQPDSPMTQLGLRAMTPEYAAPEQVRREPVSTATDVYALGVVLYELMTGVHPFQRSATSREKLIRAICDTNPELPSGHLQGPHALRRAQAFGLRPAAMRRRLRGDLDTIMLKAMAKAPERRYGSVDGLAEDLRRFRDGLPIKARRDSVAYRTRRFIGRHRLPLAATLAVMISLLAGMVGVWQQGRVAAVEARRAEQSLEFLTGLFRSGDPRLGQPLETIDQLLEKGSEQATIGLDDDPILQGSVLLRLAEVRLSRTQFEKAGELADLALDLFREELREPDRRLADALRVAGASRYTRGMAAESEPLMRAAAAQYGALGDHAREAEVMSSVAGMLRGTEGYQAAVELQRRVVSELRSALGPDHPAMGPARYALGVFAIDAGEYDLAEQELRQALELAERRGSDGEIEQADIGLMLGSLLDRTGRSDEAGPWLEASVASFIKLLGEDAAPVANARFTLGLFQLGQQQFEEAEAQFRGLTESQGASPMTRAHAHRYLGIALTRLQRLDEATDELNQAHAAYLEIGGVANQEQAWRAQADLGYVRALQGDAALAVESLSEAVAGIESIRGPENYVLIQPISYLALALELVGDSAQATVLAERAITMADKLVGREHRLSSEVRERHTLLTDI